MKESQDWSLEGLNEAYRKGYMQGLASRDRATCPYQDQTVLESAWEAGWSDGSEALCARRQPNPGSERRHLG